MKYSVAEGTAEQAFSVAQHIPEFQVSPYGLQQYTRRLGPGSLTLIGFYGKQPVGFKCGYPRGPSDSFYSWMGGVLPSHRRRGVALLLAQAQEKWAKTKGYARIWFKTRNQMRPMLIFALKNGFHIKEVLPRDHIKDYRIILEKPL